MMKLNTQSKSLKIENQKDPIRYQLKSIKLIDDNDIRLLIDQYNIIYKTPRMTDYNHLKSTMPKIAEIFV